MNPPNPIVEITHQGQSIWYDYIQRGMIWTGSLYRMMREDALRGVTSNPAIFEKAIGGSRDYTAALKAAVRAGAGPMESFERIAVQDIQLACDVLRETYDATNARDGYVSFEVSPHIALDTEATIADARRIWKMVHRDNLMVKIPATPAGIPAIEAAISEGININVTLLFAVDAYEAVHRAYLSGLEKFVQNGGDPSRIASVASFFVSRIDTLVDKMLDDRQNTNFPRGKVAIANAKLAYRSYEQTIASERWKKLAEKGAKTQRLLWASTGTKNPKYRDVLYVEELIGPDTVNTVPEATYNAFKDHGKVGPTLLQGVEEAAETMKALAAADISMKAVTDRLLADGVVLFADAFDRLLSVVEKRRRELLGAELSLMSGANASEARLEKMRTEAFTRRFWNKDATLWSSRPEDQKAISGFMGWLGAVDNVLADSSIETLVRGLPKGEIDHVVLMGMGGSSLAPEVFARTFGRQQGWPEMLVLDSTVPAQVSTIERKVKMDRTLFVVASKSGSTIEPLVFDKYFFDKSKQGARFVAITDPNSKLERESRARDFRAIIHGDPEVGGRYSSLSPFGMTAAALLGVDVKKLLERAKLMVQSTGPEVPPADNPGVRLGAYLGELALAGRDKLTLVSSKSLTAFGAWVEQLVAESTGKLGKGIVPVDGEKLSGPEVYGKDRLFVYLKLRGEDDAELERKLSALEAAGHPVIRFTLLEKLDLVQEMFLWEVATATAGAVLEINPFDQPNVQESKDYTMSLLGDFQKNGKLPEIPGEVKLLESGNVVLYTDQANAAALAGKSVQEIVTAHLARVGSGDYVALNAYLEMNAKHDAALQTVRNKIRDEKKVATTVGFGPRFLHSTGQLHKGGANNGVFVQITVTDAVDLPIPGEKFSFSVLKGAQEAGDFLALSKRGRRLLRVHFKDEASAERDLLQLFGK
jgi:transaldolase/glucose-6-phosphate isomerase